MNYEDIDIKWHPIHDDYGADKEGNVYSRKARFIIPLSLIIRKNKYLSFNLHKYDGKIKQQLVHQFVYECFNHIVPFYSTATGNGLTINHIDNNGKNNRPENLELITNRLNIQKAKPRKYYSYNKYNKCFRVIFANPITKKTKQYGEFKTEEKAIERVKLLKEQGIIF